MKLSKILYSLEVVSYCKFCTCHIILTEHFFTILQVNIIYMQILECCFFCHSNYIFQVLQCHKVYMWRQHLIKKMKIQIIHQV